ncbi:unnamed protein product [Fusarium fujikuroi]|nr:hypothetical protein CEK25_003645 [Fusarium fujikuroi]VZH99358.1 unnamed protein product [Fusarium fujikuroi]
MRRRSSMHKIATYFLLASRKYLLGCPQYCLIKPVLFWPDFTFILVSSSLSADDQWPEGPDCHYSADGFIMTDLVAPAPIVYTHRFLRSEKCAGLTVLKQWNGTTADQDTQQLSDLKLPIRAQVEGASITKVAGSSHDTRGGVFLRPCHQVTKSALLLSNSYDHDKRFVTCLDIIVEVIEDDTRHQLHVKALLMIVMAQRSIYEFTTDRSLPFWSYQTISSRTQMNQKAEFDEASTKHVLCKTRTWLDPETLFKTTCHTFARFSGVCHLRISIIISIFNLAPQKSHRLSNSARHLRLAT